ncbi:hypothetical protein CRG98_023695 [Punica granatum]|uniref:Uncharacterized protein n=1 Tax=Punica granatum TaxID=22663 RepID=A0A2I0JJ20_PUNGR|nr:hypothetical protein CRG98_023695 [Punica granatum]
MFLCNCKRRLSSLVILFLFVLTTISASSKSATAGVEARMLTSNFPNHQHPEHGSGDSITKIFNSLGIVCKCCSESGADCLTSWTGSCPDKLQCLPWKLS